MTPTEQLARDTLRRVLATIEQLAVTLDCDTLEVPALRALRHGVARAVPRLHDAAVALQQWLHDTRHHDGAGAP